MIKLFSKLLIVYFLSSLFTGEENHEKGIILCSTEKTANMCLNIVMQITTDQSILS